MPYPLALRRYSSLEGVAGSSAISARGVPARSLVKSIQWTSIAKDVMTFELSIAMTLTSYAENSYSLVILAALDINSRNLLLYSKSKSLHRITSEPGTS